jgi:hypothetical protein
MGMFDTIYCEYPLPDARHQYLDFQTKNLECLLDTYTITVDGRLVRRARRGWGAGAGPERDIEWPLHGDIRIYTSVKSEDPPWVEYVVRFTHGVVEWIRPLAEVQRDPDLPPRTEHCLWNPLRPRKRPRSKRSPLAPPRKPVREPCPTPRELSS